MIEDAMIDSSRGTLFYIGALCISGLLGCGGDGPGATGGAGGTGGNGGAPPLMVGVTTLLELQEDCAGVFDTSPPPIGEPATFTVDGDRILVRGTLGPTTANRLQAALEENPNARTLVLTYVPGTVDAVQSDDVARSVRRANLGTCVPDNGYIASGGVNLFFGGSVRQIAPSNQGVVVHGWITEQCLPTGECPETPDAESCIRGADLPVDDSRHEPFLEVYRDLGLPMELYFWIFDQATSFCEPHFMTVADLEMFSFETSNTCIDSPPEAICNTPPGLFTESCRNCFFDEPILSCDCQDLAGRLQTTSIDTTTCAGLISNCGGELSCDTCEVGTSLFSIAWEGSLDLDLAVTDPQARSVGVGGANDTPNCTASADVMSGPGAVEAVSCESPLAGVYTVHVEKDPAGGAEPFTFSSLAPAGGPLSVPYEVDTTLDIFALVGETLELELMWDIHDNLELILVDEETMRAVTPRGTAFDPLPGCTPSADNDGSDIFESPHRETISCSGLDVDNYQIEVQNPGGGLVFEVPYTLQIRDGSGSAVTVESSAQAATRREHELTVLGRAGIIDGFECTSEAQCAQPTAACRVAVCEANACVIQDAPGGSPCRDDQDRLGTCTGSTCIPIGGLGL